MKEWVVSEEDLGCDGAYFSHNEVIRCKDCKWYTTYTDFDGKVMFCGVCRCPDWLESTDAEFSNINNFRVFEDHYCGYGRKENRWLNGL